MFLFDKKIFIVFIHFYYFSFSHEVHFIILFLLSSLG